MIEKDIKLLLDNLEKTKFRGSFHLNNQMKKYVKEKTIAKIEADALNIILKRIAVANPTNDGKQTPMKQVHPVFIAQHATATCCRSCLEKIHHIQKGQELNDEQVQYIIKVIKSWILKEMQ